MKKRLFISFSGGLTSAYMTDMLLRELDRAEWEIVVVFANTGKEREETLQFVKKCDEVLGFGTVWIEAVTNPQHRKGTTSKVVSFETASRNGEPFEAMIGKYGIPNVVYGHCTRELKTVAMTHYIRRVLGWRDYYTAIGIRADEADRINPNGRELKYIYPLVSRNIRREDVNRFWINQPFTLELKSYEGNCDLCFKKSLRKLMTLCNERPAAIQWWRDMEEKYGDYIPESRLRPWDQNWTPERPVRFYRDGRNILNIAALAKEPFILARDQSGDIIKEQTLFPLDDLDISNGCSESCEPF